MRFESTIFTLDRVKIRKYRCGERKKNRAYLYDRNRSGMHGQVYVQLCSDTPLRGTVPSMVIRGTRCKRVPPTLRTETRIKRVICLVFEGKGKTFVQLEKGKNSRYWINICSAHGRTPLSLCLLSSMILNIFLIFNLFIYSFLLLHRLFLFMALRNCKYKEFFINSLDEKILMRVFFKRILHSERLIFTLNVVTNNFRK